jgi:GntR family transcriptional regulator
MLFLSANDPRPMYQQIVDQITAHVLVGDWPPGFEMPSIRELAASSGVSVITVKRAYEELERAGLIHTRHGKGSVVSEQAEPARRALDDGLDAQLKQASQQAARLGLSRDVVHSRLDQALDGEPHFSKSDHKD